MYEYLSKVMMATSKIFVQYKLISTYCTGVLEHPEPSPRFGTGLHSLVQDSWVMGAEAAVHTARKFLQNLEDGHALVKLDFTNAFNSICTDKMLEAIHDLAPSIYPLAHSAYSASSSPVR